MKHCILILALALSACGATGQTSTWVRTDGRDIKSSAELQRQREIDAQICLGEAQKAELSAGPSNVYDPVRERAVIDVAKGCMAARGYINVPIEQEEEARRKFASSR